ILEMRAHTLGELDQDMARAFVDDGMHGVEAQPIEMEFLKPVECVFDIEIADRPCLGTIEVDRGTPGRVMAIGDEIRRVEMEIIALGAEVVVDDVEKYRETPPVAGLDEALQIGGPPILRIGREEQH